MALAALIHLSVYLGHQVVVIRGASMAPAIPIGAAALIRHTGPRDVAVGDVVTIRQENGALITHRVTRVMADGNDRRFETRGDANAIADPALVTGSSIVGVVTIFLPVAGYLVALLSVPVGIFTLLSLLMLIVATSWALGQLRGSRSLDHAPAV